MSRKKIFCALDTVGLQVIVGLRMGKEGGALVRGGQGLDRPVESGNRQLREDVG